MSDERCEKRLAQIEESCVTAHKNLAATYQTTSAQSENIEKLKRRVEELEKTVEHNEHYTKKIDNRLAVLEAEVVALKQHTHTTEHGDQCDTMHTPKAGYPCIIGSAYPCAGRDIKIAGDCVYYNNGDCDYKRHHGKPAPAKTLDELASEQGVKPMTAEGLRTIIGSFPELIVPTPACADACPGPKPVTRQDTDTIYAAVHDVMRRFEMWADTGKLLNHGYTHDDDPRYATRKDVQELKELLHSLRHDIGNEMTQTDDMRNRMESDIDRLKADVAKLPETLRRVFAEELLKMVPPRPVGPFPLTYGPGERNR